MRRSYRKLAREKHHDKKPEKTNAHSEFIELKEAYDATNMNEAFMTQALDLTTSLKEGS